MARKTILIGSPALLVLIFFGLTQADQIKLFQSIPLPNVKGRIDHMALDSKNHRLYIAALGNNTVEVVDLKLGRQIHSITGFDEPQDVLWTEKSNKLIVSNGGDGSCQILDPSSFKRIGTIKLGDDDADNMRYDASANRAFV